MLSSEELQSGLKALLSLLVIMDPIGIVPLFLVYTREFSPRERFQIARTAFVGSVLVLLTAQFAGDMLLKIFGIGIPSFRVAGGILILLLALDMMNARPSRSKSTPEEEMEKQGKHEIAIVPVAVPLIAGPGAISAVILMASRDDAPMHQGKLTALVVVACLVCFGVLALGSRIEQWLGRTGMNIVTRLMGLVSAAVAVEFIAAGLKGLFPMR
jgi:multiple antibiotic resistance protein